eukprot:CAMPEP_0177175576 /NCGR_PEP_ID=MMETSP0367-20130122/12784_1 /TAXON_ID=447022 ORGANISM="Scrippsiella hangoei-like, Strain SHHI-4" /NCGR_SAMPLE_ID=MMETSP0367 /ASSEMBLY_ACC=CAM_ASM_000362 /LENGTH=219 /DNA_ID=CAMNT_0018622007 /DNA_START=45 /DNA_END=704 /DNA_ORIENTATION=+
MSLASSFCALYKLNEKRGSRCQAMSGLNELRFYTARSRRSSCRARAPAKPNALSNSDCTSGFRATLAACNVSKCSHFSSLQISRNTLASFRTSLSMLARLSTSAESTSSTNPTEWAVDSVRALSLSHLSVSLRGRAAWRASQAALRHSNSAHLLSLSACRASSRFSFSALWAWRCTLSSATLCKSRKGNNWQFLAKCPALRHRVHTTEEHDIETEDMTR